MLDWTQTTLGEVGEWGSGGTPLSSNPEYYGGSIPWLIIEDLNDDYVFGSQRTITEAGLKNSSAKLLQPSTLLIAMYGSIGKLGITGFSCATNQAIAFCKPDSKQADIRFLFYYLLHSRPRLNVEGRGGTQQNISQAILKDFPIVLPRIEEQKRIAVTLDKADRLRRTRRYTQQLSDTFLQSVFAELFYKESANQWPIEEVESLAKRGAHSIRTGPFGSQLLHSEFTDKGDVAVLGIDNVVQNHFNWDKRRFITAEKYKSLKRYTVSPNDVLITLMGTCGRCAIVPQNIQTAINTKHLCCITLDQSKCLPIYLQYSFLSHPFVLKQLGVSGRGAVMPGLNMTIIKELKIPLPPMSLQEKFSRIVHRFERLHTQQREAARQAEHLFQTLLHRAFRGEL